MQPSAYPTKFYESANQPADTGRIAEYGQLGEIPAAIFEQFGMMFSGSDAPNPTMSLKL